MTQPVKAAHGKTAPARSEQLDRHTVYTWTNNTTNQTQIRHGFTNCPSRRMLRGGWCGDLSKGGIARKTRVRDIVTSDALFELPSAASCPQVRTGARGLPSRWRWYVVIRGMSPVFCCSPSRHRSEADRRTASGSWRTPDKVTVSWRSSVRQSWGVDESDPSEHIASSFPGR